MLLRCLAPLALLLSVAACSSDGTPTTTSTTGTPDGDGQCGLGVTPNSEWCAGQKVTNDCSNVIGDAFDICGVAEQTPTSPLVRSTAVDEFSGSGPPQLSCFAVGSYPAKPAASMTAKAVGRARIFSHGSQSNSLTIEFHKVVRDGSDADGDVGELVGAAVITEDDCHANGTATEGADGATRYECPYAYPNLPTETELLVKTTGTIWADLYDYNIYIFNADVKDGAWAHDVRALAASDYTLIPTAAYGSPVTQGNGAIAGEVHDCGDVRLSGALVNVDKSNSALVYFSGDEAAPNPDLTATHTNVLGLYAAFDIAPGPVTAAAIGVDNDKVQTLGFVRARIFPNAVTAVTFRGVLPFQVP